MEYEFHAVMENKFQKKYRKLFEKSQYKEGLCAKCGYPRVAGKKLCVSHLRAKKRNELRRIARESGICMACLTNPAGDNDGLCPSCYTQIMKVWRALGN